jgi:hypothetical protein
VNRPSFRSLLSTWLDTNTLSFQHISATHPRGTAIVWPCSLVVPLLVLIGPHRNLQRTGNDDACVLYFAIPAQTSVPREHPTRTVRCCEKRRPIYPPTDCPLHDRTSTYFQPQCQCLAPLLTIETLCNPTLLTAVSSPAQSPISDTWTRHLRKVFQHATTYRPKSAPLPIAVINQERKKKPAITIRSGACGLYLHTGGTVLHAYGPTHAHPHR